MTNTLRGALALLLVIVAAGCGLERRAEVQGRIVGFGDDGRTLIVEHAEIPGVMPAMTMPFETRETGLLDTLAVRDAVGFTLVITRSESWIENLHRLPDGAVPAHPAATVDEAYDGPASPLLEPGEAVPAVALVDQDGAALTLADFEGKLVLLTFIYTRCPLPDFCPRLSQNFQQLQPLLQERFGDRVQLLSVSFDPAYDTPEVLHAYARRYTDDRSTWTFATGTPEDVTTLATALGMYFQESAAQFDHNLATALIGPEGRLIRIWRGTDWRPEAVMRLIAENLPR